MALTWPDTAHPGDGDHVADHNLLAANGATLEARVIDLEASAGGVVPGGTTGQVLTKASNDDGDVEWSDPTGGGAGLSTDAGQQATLGTDDGILVSGLALASDLAAKVDTTDLRLSDARTPTAHSHAPADITGTAVITTDARLSDARTPTAHKTSHATGGSDALAASDIGAASATHAHDAGDIASGTVATARLGSGSASSATVLRGDQTWAAPSLPGPVFPVASGGVGVDDWSLAPGVLPSGNLGSVNISVGVLWYFPFLVSEPLTLTAAAVRTTQGVANTLARVGVFAANGSWQPSSLVNELATFATTSNAVVIQTGLSIALTPGRYLVGFRTEGGGNPGLSYAGGYCPGGRFDALSSGGGPKGNYIVSSSAAFSSLPAWTALASALGAGPVFWRWTVS